MDLHIVRSVSGALVKLVQDSVDVRGAVVNLQNPWDILSWIRHPDRFDRQSDMRG